MSHSWKAKIDNVRSTYPAVDTIPQVIDDVKFRGKKPIDDVIPNIWEYLTKSQQFLRWFGDWQNKPDILLQQRFENRILSPHRKPSLGRRWRTAEDEI